MLAKGEFFFRQQDITAQQEFLSYPKGKHDDILDAIWTALEKYVPCRLETLDGKKKRSTKRRILDWMVQ
jgi:hypothetical protein